METSDITALYNRIKGKDSARQSKMMDVLAVREGRMKDVYRELFPDGPFQDGIVANMIDVAARDLSEVMAPLPAFNCTGKSSVSDASRRKAEKRTQIANGYISTSKVQIQMFTTTDEYLSYGFVIGMVEPDFKAKMPRIQFYSPLGAYYLKNRWGETQAVFMSKMWDLDELLAAYPDCRGYLQSEGLSGSQKIEVVRYCDDKRDLLFLPQGNGWTLTVADNVFGKCLAKVIERPGATTHARGQFDDVLAVQVAKARFALLTLEAATKAVQAPIALPNDVVELNVGPDSVLRTATPEKIGRVSLQVPNEVFAQQASLENDLAKGSRYPGPRTGEIDGSVVTGRGVEALMSGFDTQVRTGQAMFADAFTELIALAFEMDEKFWGSTKKSLRGNVDGIPYEVEYTPEKDINGEYTVDVQYGLMAGLDPNRALVFGLQARGDSLISRDFLRRQMPFAVNATEEEQKIDVEEMRDALKQAVAGYAQAIPVLAQSGADPGQILTRLASIITGRQKGDPIEQVIAEAFEPPEMPAAETPPEVDPLGAAASPVPGSPGGGPSGGLGSDGLMTGVAPGQAGQAPGGRPDVANLLAGLTQRGEPNLQASVSRRNAL